MPELSEESWTAFSPSPWRCFETKPFTTPHGGPPQGEAAMIPRKKVFS